MPQAAHLPVAFRRRDRSLSISQALTKAGTAA